MEFGKKGPNDQHIQVWKKRARPQLLDGVAAVGHDREAQLTNPLRDPGQGLILFEGLATQHRDAFNAAVATHHGPEVRDEVVGLEAVSPLLRQVLRVQAAAGTAMPTTLHPHQKPQPRAIVMPQDDPIESVAEPHDHSTSSVLGASSQRTRLCSIGSSRSSAHFLIPRNEGVSPSIRARKVETRSWRRTSDTLA